MSEQNLMVSPEKLGAEIRELTRQAKAMTLYYGVEIGRRLEAAKSMVPYGGWGRVAEGKHGVFPSDRDQIYAGIQ